MKNYILLAVAVLAGILAFIISVVHITNEREALKRQYQEVDLAVFKTDMYKDQKIASEDIGRLPFFKRDLVAPGQVEIAWKDAEQLIGRTLRVDVKKKEPIRWHDLDIDLGRQSGSDLARLIDEEDNERALTISVDAVSSVAGLVEPGDHVDILATFRFPAEEQTAMDTVTLTLLQNVTVLATGQQVAAARAGSSPGSGRGRGYSNLTLAVTPKEAEMLVFAQRKGQLTLTLRHPEDVYVIDEVQDVNFQYLKDHLHEYMREREERLMEQR